MAFLALPFMRLETPGWGKLARALGVIVDADSKKWKGAPTRTIRGKVHGYLMELNLSNWSERMTYFFGRYYELHTQLLLGKLLSIGDRFVDIGGNIGMISLVAAKIVGEHGQVEIFEPNPVCLARIRKAVEINSLRNLTIFPYGLSNKEETLTLTVMSNHTGVGSFVKVDSENVNISDQMDLKLVKGDTHLILNKTKVKLVKIDVEGFELNTLLGMSDTLKRDQPMIIIELIEAQLNRAGASTEAIFNLLTDIGYRAYGVSLERSGRSKKLKLTPLIGSKDAAGYSDVLWSVSGTAGFYTSG